MEGFKEYLVKERKALVILPIYIYDHGSITITARYERYLQYPDKQWDAGQVGFIYAVAGMIGETPSSDVAEILAREVDAYDRYLTGDVWGYVIEDEDGEHLDSCWGFYGLDYAREEATAAAGGR